MKIKSFKYRNGYQEWELTETTFDPSLNLLVGASGVGKTKILRALMDVLRFSYSKRTNSIFNDTAWQLDFYAHSDLNCSWQVEFQHNLVNGNSNTLIANEKLIFANY